MTSVSPAGLQHGSRLELVNGNPFSETDKKKLAETKGIFPTMENRGEKIIFFLNETVTTKHWMEIFLNFVKKLLKKQIVNLLKTLMI